ncbi:MAG: GumC family protein [Planctomycetota bacterium]|jgi:uncharacterized protein involved in exopolysaccharide biosynthesis
MAGEAGAGTGGGPPAQWTTRDVAGVLFRRKGTTCAFFAAAGVAAAAYVVLAPEVYRSEAKLLVRIGRESVALDPTATTGPIISVARSRMNEINSELEILRSRDLAEGVVDALGPGRILRPGARPGRVGADGNGGDGALWREKAVRAVLDAVDISVVKDSNVIAASFEAADPELAREVLRKLMALYLDRHIAVHRTSGSHSFFAAETEKRRASLDRIETALRDLKNESGVASLEDQREILSLHVGELEREVAKTDAARAAAWARLDALISQVESLPPMRVSSETSGIPGTAVEAMRERLYELQLEEHDLRTRYRRDSIPIRQIRRQIEEAQLLLSREEATHKEVTRELNTTRRDLEFARCVERANVASLDAARRAQARALADAAERLKAFNGTALRIGRLERERELEEAKFREYSEKCEQARVDQALEERRISNIGIVQPATLPVKAVRPRKKLILALGLLFGLTGGVAVAFLGEHLGRGFHTPEDVERRTGCPALAAIPLCHGGTGRARGGPPSEAYALRAFEELRERLLLVLGADGGSPKTVGVLGSDLGEGASTVAAGLAVRLARGGSGPVLLVDACLHGGAAHRAFGLVASPGLGDLLEGTATEEDVIARSGIAELDVLPAGDGESGVRLAQHIAALGRAMDVWRERYRFVVLDLPPVGQAPAAARAGAALDGAVLVVEAGRSRFEAFARTRDLLVKSGGRILGAVLNKRRFPVPQWVYDRI